MEFATKAPQVARWLSKVGFSSREVYLKNLLYYTKCVNLTPFQLLQLKISEDRNLLFYPAEDLLEAWIKDAENGGVKPSRINGVVLATRSFYRHNRLILADVDYVYCPKEKLDVQLEDLRRFRKGFDFFGKVLFDFILSVPVRDGQFQICPHCGQDFHPRWRNILTYPKIEPYSPFLIKTQKGHEKKKRRRKLLMQLCYLSPSAVQGLTTYRSFKEAALGRRLRPDEYIFTHNFENAYGVIHVSPIGRHEVIGLFYRARIKTGVRISVHRARDWSESVLTGQRIDETLRDLYLGHECSYRQGYLMQMLPQWKQTFRKAKALEALDIRPPALKKDPIDELCEGLGISGSDVEVFKRVLKQIRDKER
jgi:hypothetical protein